MNIVNVPDDYTPKSVIVNAIERQRRGRHNCCITAMILIYLRRIVMLLWFLRSGAEEPIAHDQHALSRLAPMMCSIL